MDAYQGLTHEYNFLHYCLFVTFFPQLIAGPIVHHREMLPQFARAQMYSLQVTNISIGLTIFTIGLFKKVVIADRVAFYATPVFASAELGQDITFFSAWTGAVAYTLQLYFDFSGYSDMAIGLARMFGITLPLNFNSPYQAINIVDFWDRWHMTLSRFLRDYLYIPLGGNRHGSWRRHTNIMITMLLGGLWHGAGWTFIAWGGLHGFYLIANNLWHNLWRRPINRWWSRTIARFITLLTIMIAWVFFRAETFGGALHILAAMANLPNTLGDYIGPLKPIFGMVGIGFSGGYLAMEHYKALLWATFWLTVLWFWPNTQQLMAGFRPTLDKNDVYGPKTLFAWVGRIQWQPSGWWGVVLGVMAAVTFLSLSQISEFLYFQF